MKKTHTLYYVTLTLKEKIIFTLDDLYHFFTKSLWNEKYKWYEFKECFNQ